MQRSIAPGRAEPGRDAPGLRQRPDVRGPGRAAPLPLRQRPRSALRPGLQPLPAAPRSAGALGNGVLGKGILGNGVLGNGKWGPGKGDPGKQSPGKREMESWETGNGVLGKGILGNGVLGNGKWSSGKGEMESWETESWETGNGVLGKGKWSPGKRSPGKREMEFWERGNGVLGNGVGSGGAGRERRWPHRLWHREAMSGRRRRLSRHRAQRADQSRVSPVLPRDKSQNAKAVVTKAKMQRRSLPLGCLRTL
ncbi:hypothetical protein RLOC_00012217 [Lonchura striata]|uniref:Uncharacterized protein n=1 Tax=Lonchura striata TaxID=40157 RepID=A0A218UCA8_9PASE|nr:hypothetical protein RLOC_00012217 [Lonchura striata domestica]